MFGRDIGHECRTAQVHKVHQERGAHLPVRRVLRRGLEGSPASRRGQLKLIMSV